jgi:coenzyme PQQ synthesis protein D (PqqD)
MIDPAGTFRKEVGFVTRTIAGETIIVPIRGGVGELDAIFTLNEVGTRIWQLLDRPLTVDQMAGEIAGEHEVEPAVAARDVAEFLATLEGRGLIRPAAACSP